MESIYVQFHFFLSHLWDFKTSYRTISCCNCYQQFKDLILKGKLKSFIIYSSLKVAKDKNRRWHFLSCVHIMVFFIHAIGVLCVYVCVCVSCVCACASLVYLCVCLCPLWYMGKFFYDILFITCHLYSKCLCVRFLSIYPSISYLSIHLFIYLSMYQSF